MKENLKKYNLASVRVVCRFLFLYSITAGCSFAAEMNSPQAQELIAEANSNSFVRVLVTLALDARGDEGKQVIKKAQEELLIELSLFRVKLLKQYQLLPILALEVDLGALGYLLASPSVYTVSSDALFRTMSTTPSRQTQDEE